MKYRNDIPVTVPPPFDRPINGDTFTLLPKTSSLRTRLSDEQVLRMRHEHRLGKTAAELARMYRISDYFARVILIPGYYEKTYARHKHKK